MPQLPTPPIERDAIVGWVAEHLAGSFAGPVERSTRFTGGQTAADAALEAFDVTGYAAARNEVLPVERRGASALSPYIRHGLLSLRHAWDAVEGGPGRDVAKFRDELMWQEYARHLYARVGKGSQQGLRRRQVPVTDYDQDVVWDRSMACVELAIGELENAGWMVNQTRMWMASQWAVRHDAPWRDGEDLFFRHLLDGSRAANRLGWQWTAGLAIGRTYGFSRHQVERRAPGLCNDCTHEANCPIAEWPDDPIRERADEEAGLRRVDVEPQSGPPVVERSGDPEVVWLTAESLGDDDPALVANPEMPAVFVFDEALLRRLQLSAKRLVFMAECLADLDRRRPVEVHVGRPIDVLAGRHVAVTFAPVPGFGRIVSAVEPVEVHPWTWLHRPQGGPVQSFSAWKKSLR